MWSGHRALTVRRAQFSGIVLRSHERFFLLLLSLSSNHLSSRSLAAVQPQSSRQALLQLASSNSPVCIVEWPTVSRLW